MTKFFAFAFAVAAVALAGPLAWAQQVTPGARAGNSYIPSTHSPGCSGIMCDSDDPRRAAGAPPPPPCEGLLCGVSPYGMQRPVTSGDAQRIREEQARTVAAAGATGLEPAAKSGHKRRKSMAAKAKAGKAKSVATRTPDPGLAAPEAR